MTPRPAFNVEAERALLGELMCSYEAIAAVEELRAEFFSPPNAVIFNAIVRLYTARCPVLLTSVTQELMDTHQLAEAGGAAHITELAMAGIGSPAIARHFADMVLRQWANRRGREISTRLQAELESGAGLAAFHAALAEVEAVEATAQAPQGKPLTPLMNLGSGEPDPRHTVLGERYLCLGGALLFVGPSGIGKSSASVQQDILWSLGRPAFGIRPARPLRILTVQAENDAEDLAEMREGVCRGLGLSEEDREQVRERVFYEREDARTGADFLAWLHGRLAKEQFDLVRLDPLLAYLGADANDAQQTAAFLRQGLNPLLARHRVACVINHHTPKVVNRDTTGWRGSDWMYAGSGSADIVNWARAVLVIDPTHTAHVFRFIAAKRGGRIGWTDDTGTRETTRHFCHAADGLYWRPATAEDLAESEEARPASGPARAGSGLPAATAREKLKALLPAEGTISKNALVSKASALKIGYHRARSLIEELIADEEIFVVEKQRHHARPELHLTRCRPQAPGEPARRSQPVIYSGYQQPVADSSYLQPCQQPEITGISAQFG